jgi:hypothetical protein
MATPKKVSAALAAIIGAPIRAIAANMSNASAIATGSRAVLAKSVASPRTRGLSCPRSTIRCSMDGAIRSATAIMMSVSPAHTKTREEKGKNSNCC